MDHDCSATKVESTVRYLGIEVDALACRRVDVEMSEANLIFVTYMEAWVPKSRSWQLSKTKYQT